MSGVIKQENDWSCVACCVASITDTTLNDFYDYCGHDGSDKVEGPLYTKHGQEIPAHPDGRRGFSIMEVIHYLVDRGFLPFFPAEYPIAMDYDALVFVKSKKHIGGSHALIWRAEKRNHPDRGLWCPINGKVNLVEMVSHGRLLYWMPVNKMEKLEGRI